MLQFFRVIDGQADQMRGLIADLLDQGRIETGTLSVSLAPAEVAGLVDQARSTFLGSGGGHALSIDLPEDLPWMMADSGRIVQDLNNLFSKASRHSPESSPIRVAAARDGLHVAISVSDRGRGVPPDRLPHLFRERAGAAAGAGERRPGGSGLGLSICKGLVEAHGGRTWVESAGAGRGTRTIVRALDAGAADDIGKPVSPSELTARVRGALRRRAEPEPFLLGELAIHYEERRVTVAGRLVTLTMTEFEVLRVLSTNAGRAVTYESLRRRAWGRRDRAAPTTRSWYARS